MTQSDFYKIEPGDICIHGPEGVRVVPLREAYYVTELLALAEAVDTSFNVEAATNILRKIRGS